jgi:DNA-binding CsgD family transcriptional regulator/tetratricopeptide (TPR) repeat protein
MPLGPPNRFIGAAQFTRSTALPWTPCANAATPLQQQTFFAPAAPCLPGFPERVTMRRVSMLRDPHLDVPDRLVERDNELAVLEHAFEKAATGRGGIALITAEAGGGKTALIDRFCDGLPGRGRVLRGACDPLLTPRPLGPIHDFASDAGPQLTERLVGDAVPYQVAAGLLEELCENGPTVAVIEDVHWADEATLDVLSVLVRRIESIGVLIVLSYRDEAVGAAHPLRVVLGNIATGLALTRLPLAPLSHEAVADLAEPFGLDADELHEVTGGNPFYVTEVIASGGAEIPATVRDAVLARAGGLSREARAVLEATAIVATPLAELWLVEALSGEIDARLDECIASGMLVDADGAVIYRHELARLAIEESLPTARRLGLHRSALEALTSRRHDEVNLARLAHHADAAGDAEAVLRFAPAAGAYAASVGAHREAAEQYARALRHADALPPREVAELLRRRSRECYLTDQADEAIAALQSAVEVYRELGDRAKTGETLAKLSTISWCPGRGEQARTIGREAVALLEQLPPGPELAAAYANLGFLQPWVGDHEGADEWARRALDLAETLEEPSVLCQALIVMAWRELPRDRERGLALVERATALAEEHGLDEHLWDTYLARAESAASAHLNDLARLQFEEGLTYGRTHGNEIVELYLLAGRAVFELNLGRWSEAAETAKLVLGLPSVSTHPRTTALWVLALVRARRGDPGAGELIADARALAYPTRELGRIVPVALADAEIAWLRGSATDAGEATDNALELALEARSTGDIVRLEAWRRRAGITGPLPAVTDGPYALELSGDAAAAAVLWREFGQPYDAALALAEVGTQEALRESLEGLTALGARAAAAIVSRRLRALGVRDIPRGPRPATRQNAAGLTARQSEVLALLATGLRNAEIAERLFLSQRTVDNHVAAILGKLGTDNRVGAVAKAAELGLLER